MYWSQRSGIEQGIYRFPFFVNYWSGWTIRWNSESIEYCAWEIEERNDREDKDAVLNSYSLSETNSLFASFSEQYDQGETKYS